MLASVFCFVIGFLSIATGQGLSEGYGQQCTGDGTKPCILTDMSDPLKCTSNNDTLGFCGCDDGMFRHTVLNLCRSEHGQNCTVKATSGPIRKCTEHALCYPSTGKCVCDPDTKHDVNTGECKFAYGSTRCNRETECDYLSFLTCLENKCVCQNQELQIYNGDEGVHQCQALLGGSCSDDAIGSPKCYAKGHMKCDGDPKKCVCESGYDETSDKICGLGFDKNCNNETLICADPFKCHETEQKCRCTDDQEHNSGTCLINAGKSCTEEDNPLKLECTAHADCQNGECTCQELYTNVNGKCIGSLGADCNATSICNEADYLICSEQSNKCTCKENYDEDSTNKKCIGWLGEACKSDQDHDGCISNSECRNNNGNLQCQCPNRFKQNAGNVKECFGLHGATCSDSILCSREDSLACSEGQCGCQSPEDQIHNESEDFCVGKAGKPCANSRCVENSLCDDAQDTCTCNNGYQGNEEGLCVPRGGGGGGGAGTLVVSSVLFVIVGIITGKTYYV